MFCGLPLKLTTPPTFAAPARASRYGSAGSFASTTTATTSGVSTTHTVSLTSSADNAPATKINPNNSERAERARTSTRYAASRKNCACWRYAAITSTPNNSSSTCRSIARSAVHRQPTDDNHRTPPTTAPAGRSMRMRESRTAMTR